MLDPLFPASHCQQLSKPDTSEQQVKEIQEGLAAAKLSTTELGKLQDRQRAAIERSIGRAGGSSMNPGSGETSPTSPIHPDLQDLQFGPLGAAQRCVNAAFLPIVLADTYRPRHAGVCLHPSNPPCVALRRTRTTTGAVALCRTTAIMSPQTRERTTGLALLPVLSLDAGAMWMFPTTSHPKTCGAIPSKVYCNPRTHSPTLSLIRQRRARRGAVLL